MRGWHHGDTGMLSRRLGDRQRRFGDMERRIGDLIAIQESPLTSPTHALPTACRGGYIPLAKMRGFLGSFASTINLVYSPSQSG